MNPSTVVVLLIVAGAAFLALRHLWRGRGKGCVGCSDKHCACSCGGREGESCGGCSGCNHQ